MLRNTKQLDNLGENNTTDTTTEGGHSGSK